MFLRIISACLFVFASTHVHAGLFSRDGVLTTSEDRILTEYNERTHGRDNKKLKALEEQFHDQGQSTNLATYQMTEKKDTEVTFAQKTSTLRTFSLVGRDVKQTDCVKVPGVDEPGFSKLTIQKVDETHVHAHIEKLNYEMPDQSNHLDYTVDAEFLEGNWADLLSDKNVKLAIDKASEEKSSEIIKEWLARKIKLQTLKTRGFNVNVDIQKFAFSAPELAGNLDSMTNKILTTEANFTASLF